VKFYAVLLCISGQAEISCDMNSYQVKANMMFVCPVDSVVQISNINRGRLSIILMEERFMQMINPNVNKIVPHLVKLRDNSCFALSAENCESMHKMIEIVQSSIASSRQNPYYNEFVRSLILSLTYAVLSVISTTMNDSMTEKTNSVHHQQHFKRFMQLLHVYYRSERTTKFYAEQMHITPKYLSSVISSITGRKASEWIDDFVMIEAKRLLQNTDLTIQEISIELNFPNQSFFGRYFKHHAGLSPNTFRKSK